MVITSGTGREHHHCIGWELPETRKEKLRSKLCTNTYNIK